MAGKRLPSEIVDRILNEFGVIVVPACTRRGHQVRKMYRAPIIIQKAFRQNRRFMHLECHWETKASLLRMYMIFYPIEHLLNLPEFMTRKCHLPDHILARAGNRTTRTKLHVLQFLQSEHITARTIIYSGW